MAKIVVDTKETIMELKVSEEFAQKVSDFIFDTQQKLQSKKSKKKRLFKKETVDALFD